MSKHIDLPFQKLLENLMIRVPSETIYETFGSMMVQHGAKNRNLNPKNLENVFEDQSWSIASFRWSNQ